MLSSRAFRCASLISSHKTSAVIAVPWFAEHLSFHSHEGSKFDRTRRSLHMATYCCERRRLETPLGIQSLRFSSSQKGSTPNIYGDEEDIDIFQPYQPQNHPESNERKGNKVKVKFSWKNSLVTADAINLLENIYKTHPQLIDFDETTLVQYLQTMSQFGIDVEKAAEMLLIYPRLVSIPTDKIISCVNALRSIGLSEKQRVTVLRRAPQLVDIPAKKIGKQFTFLKTYLTSSESIDIVAKSVETFLEAESTLKKKLEYLIKEMSHETKNIATCKALSFPLKHIKARHEFLIRAGLFKPIPYNKLIKTLEKDYKDRNKQREKYFRPIYVVCFKDEDFLKICTNNLLTINELAAFEELYGKEMEMEDMEEEDDDYEEDDEDDNDIAGQDAISLINSSNSQGFFNDAEAKSSYF
ncbi:unnamed protein product [Orchesella dallaii]|uniref:Transcription termination factor 3, mitochondrial n=1 Tax=Orchesella dallaii TaxID=48710 RepID=A0ABP1Q9V1_9HEXA